MSRPIPPIPVSGIVPLGLTFGIDPNSFAFKLPMIGWVGFGRDTTPVMFEDVGEEAVVAASGDCFGCCAIAS